MCPYSTGLGLPPLVGDGIRNDWGEQLNYYNWPAGLRQDTLSGQCVSRRLLPRRS